MGEIEHCQHFISIDKPKSIKKPLPQEATQEATQEDNEKDQNFKQSRY